MKVKKVGVEIEGAFKRRFEDTEIHHDGSLTVPPEVKEWVPKNRHLGEVITGPGGIDPGEVEPWIRAHYPDATNASCGIHVHVSFDKNEEGFARCSHPKFYSYFLQEMEAWGKKKFGEEKEEAFWKRLRGANEYCKTAFIPTIQSKRVGKNGNPQLDVKKGGDRYCHLNFGYQLHGTIEARLLPTFTSVDLAVSGVQRIVDIFGEWISKPWGTEVERLTISLKEGRKPREVKEPTLDQLEEMWRERMKRATPPKKALPKKSTLAPGLYQALYGSPDSWFAQ